MSRMGEVICFDTTPPIWGVREESRRGQEHEIERTKNYIDFIRRTRKQILVPAPVLSEYLIGANAPAPGIYQFHTKSHRISI
jgi:hypothetical protein